ncbi:pimeloyl-ACP methyl ester carboxylesterase [Mycobacterium sp. MAA66]|uniref:serine aminopeptidase domain-containing protein n=1 Tax=Mycobacterium sp. MAA66 TaxID=3156297 RepID=UPI0035164B96
MAEKSELTRSKGTAAIEEPTFFALDEGPLFGVLHLPADGRVRGGVFMCGSLGKEGMDSARFQRVVADSLAQHGFAVLRFDYLGTGDSAYPQGRGDAVADWLESIAQAIKYLRSIGTQSITGIGIRAGSLLLNRYLEQRPASLDNVVYLDPVSTGRRYLREHTTLYRLAVGEDATVPGSTSIIGSRIDERAAAQFSGFRFDTGHRPVNGTLVIGRSERADGVEESARVDGVESIAAEGFPEFAQSADVMVPMPLDAGDSAIDWIDRNTPTDRVQVLPKYVRSAVMPASEPNSALVEERIERIGDKALFAIRTLPTTGADAAGKSVMFFATANDSHHGPGREWVELSRQIAQSGSQAVRWDRSGLGSGGQISRDQWLTVYSTSDVNDAIDAARHTTDNPEKLELVGVCSGSWYAAHVARAVNAGHLVMINQVMWTWQVFTTWPWQWRLRKSLLASSVGAGDSAQSAEHARKRIISLLKPMRIRVGELSSRWMPRLLRVLLGHLGLLHVPEVVLSSLSRGGTEITVVASPWDVEQFGIKGGLRALDRLPGTELVHTEAGDHSAYHPAILTAIRSVVLEQPQ